MLSHRNNQHIHIRLGFLPVPSLEKYLLQSLVKNVDHELFRYIGNYLFLQKSINEIIDEYVKDNGSLNDEKGKLLFRYLSDELTLRRKSRADLVEIVVDYLFEKKSSEMIKIIEYLKQELQ